MPEPISTQRVFLTSAHKDVLQGALEAAPGSREGDSILALLARTGMADGDVEFTGDQAAYLRENLVAHMELPELEGTKYDSEMGREVARRIAGEFSDTPAS